MDWKLARHCLEQIQSRLTDLAALGCDLWVRETVTWFEGTQSRFSVGGGSRLHEGRFEALSARGGLVVSRMAKEGLIDLTFRPSDGERERFWRCVCTYCSAHTRWESSLAPMATVTTENAVVASITTLDLLILQLDRVLLTAPPASEPPPVAIKALISQVEASDIAKTNPRTIARWQKNGRLTRHARGRVDEAELRARLPSLRQRQPRVKLANGSVRRKKLAR